MNEWNEQRRFHPLMSKFQVIINNNNSGRLLHGFIITNNIWMYRYAAYAFKTSALCGPCFCWCQVLQGICPDVIRDRRYSSRHGDICDLQQGT